MTFYLQEDFRKAAVHSYADVVAAYNRFNLIPADDFDAIDDAIMNITLAEGRCDATYGLVKNTHNLPIKGAYAGKQVLNKIRELMGYPIRDGRDVSEKEGLNGIVI